MTTANTLDSMLDNVLTMRGTRHGVLFSADGLVLAKSSRITKDDADTFAAAMSAVKALSRTANENSPWRNTLIEFDDGYCLIIPAGPNGTLAVATEDTVDLEMLTIRLSELVQAVAEMLGSPARHDVGSPA